MTKEMTKLEIYERMLDAEDKYIRARADMENLKKRHEKDKEELINRVHQDLIKELLTVIDNLDLACLFGDDSHDIVGVIDGVFVTVGVKVMVDVEVQVAAERIGPETPPTRETRNFSTMPSRSADRVTAGQRLLNKGRKSGCS